MTMQLDDVKREVAIANRVLPDIGLASGVLGSLGHVSMRVPGNPEQFVVKGRGYAIDALARAEPDGMVVCDLDGFKIGGPPGIGALVLRDGVVVPPLMLGGGQERSRRGGTENVSGIVGFGTAAAAARSGLDAFAGLAALRDGLERRILEICPAATIFGRQVPRLANTSCMVMPGVPSETQVMAFDLAGIAVSAGSACSSGKVAASPVLAAMGVDEHAASSAMRVSLGWDTGPTDVDAFVKAWSSIFQRAGAAAA